MTPATMLRAAREEAGKTQADVCRAGVLSTSLVCDVEASRRRPSEWVIAGYESATGRNLDDVRRAVLVERLLGVLREVGEPSEEIVWRAVALVGSHWGEVKGGTDE